MSGRRPRPNPARLEFFGDEIDTIRAFDPASQRKLRNLEALLVTPAREVLPGKAAGIELCPGRIWTSSTCRWSTRMPASLLDYLPQQALVLVDDLDNLQCLANEIEEQAVKLRSDSISEGTLPADFPVPYLSWSEAAGQPERACLAGTGALDRRRSLPAGGAVHPWPALRRAVEAVHGLPARARMRGDRLVVVSRQIARMRELWQRAGAGLGRSWSQRSPEFHGRHASAMAGCLTLPDGKHLHLLTDSEIFGWERPQPRLRPRQRCRRARSRSTPISSSAITWCMSIMGWGATPGWCGARWTGSTAST